ncbi:YdaS family helix-turn-helix protein [Dickeya poaceiphila]|uniref:Helix-turn-helix domain-containing protein n=1 Tax=Dickeya poaceiphila TaxID=568768 RepID=A0A5B8HHW7_9GAMM|nr:YdaS family helix-turn-helix protein [Dickeya poaceiphila]QDX29515.1 helix-turn-helix domain-containing protein [Dickeya poaceiphila]
MINTQTTPLEKAVAAVGGSQKNLAEKVGVTPQAINMIKRRGGRLPARKMNKFLAATGLSKEELYPDIFSAA